VRRVRTLPKKLKKLAIVEFLILEPEKGEDVNKLRTSWYAKLSKMAKDTRSTFHLRLAINRQENHIVAWKEPKLQTR